MIGTPPGGRRRSTSGSLCETPPPPSFWTVSPVTAAKTMPMNSPLRRSGKKMQMLFLKIKFLGMKVSQTY